MASRDLERTRRYEVSDFPPGTRMLVGDRQDLDAAIAGGGVRAVGKFNPGANGVTSVPVVYVSQRALPFHERHRIALLVSGGVLLLASGIAWIILAVGLGWFLFGIGAAALAVALLARISRGGGGRTNVSVTTTTTVKVRR
jgi:hypothetical protein